MELITAYPQYTALILFIGFSVPIVIFDIREFTIPDILVYTGIASLLCYRFACTRADFLLYLAAAIVSVILFIIVRLSSKRGMGWSGVKYSALCGLYAGPVAVFAGYVLAAVTCGIWYAIKRGRGKITKESRIPFVPFIAFGTLAFGVLPLAAPFLHR